MPETDTISYTCTACGHTSDFPKAQENKAVYCPKCQAAQVIKGPGTDRFVAERIPTGRIVKAEPAPSTDRIEKPHGMAGTARIDFTCGACNHTSRISAALSGQPVRCPTCGTVQLAGVGGLRVVRIDGSGKLPFTCTACGYEARLNTDYAGKAIRCPKCQGAQVVPRILRDPSGVFQALPPAGEAPKQPGTGSHKRPSTGAFAKPAEAPKKPTTGSFAKPAPAAAPPARSEPSPALRTPAGGIPVAAPMPTPTPLPGSLATPPPGSLVAPEPEPTPSPSAAKLPTVATDGDDLDLGDAAPKAEAEPAKPKGGSVVRRSGRMAAAQPTPRPGDEPTLEPARAVQPEPEHEGPVADKLRTPAPAVPKTPAPAAPKAPAKPAAAAGHGQPAWLVPVLGVGLAVVVIAAIVLGVMYSGEASRASSLQGQLDTTQKKLVGVEKDLAETQKKLSDSEAAATAAAKERDEAKERHDALRRETDALKAEVERLKAEAAAAKPPAGGEKKPSTPDGKPAPK